SAWKQRGPAVAAVAGLAVWAFVVRARWLFASPYPSGVDGYFYPVQVRALLETHHHYYASAPLVTWIMAAVAWIGRVDPITAAKLVAAAGTALATIPAYALARRASGGSRAAGVLGAA